MYPPIDQTQFRKHPLVVSSPFVQSILSIHACKSQPNGTYPHTWICSFSHSGSQGLDSTTVSDDRVVTEENQAVSRRLSTRGHQSLQSRLSCPA